MIQRSGKPLVPTLAALALLFGGSAAIAQQSSSSRAAPAHLEARDAHNDRRGICAKCGGGQPRGS